MENQNLLEGKFEKKYKLALFILKQHYNLGQGYKLNFDKNCKLKPHYIALQKIQEIINLCTQRTRRRNYLNKLRRRPDAYLYSILEEIDQEDNDPKLYDINKKIINKMLLLNIEELEDIREIMSLGRGEITFFHYLQSFQPCRKQAVSEEEKKRLIHDLVEKEPLGEYLKRGLAAL
jgi:hypothetical protein